jgi:outer membrane protein OmpA-like peptidoglycan-associated protein
VLNAEDKPITGGAQVIILEGQDTVANFKTDLQDGHYTTALPHGGKYAVQIKADGYLFYSGFVELADSQAVWQANVMLPKAQKGAKVTLNHVYFDTDKAELLPASIPELELAAAFFTQYPHFKLRITGHTDNTGNPTNNQSLSEARARAVAHYLATKKIEIQRMETAGYGQDRPIAPNTTAAGRRLNRRTEIEIIED